MADTTDPDEAMDAVDTAAEEAIDIALNIK